MLPETSQRCVVKAQLMVLLDVIVEKDKNC